MERRRFLLAAALAGAADSAARTGNAWAQGAPPLRVRGTIKSLEGDTLTVNARDGQTLMQTTAVGHLGGATLDNEENYLIKKLFTAGLGMVCISNQARI